MSGSNQVNEDSNILIDEKKNKNSTLTEQNKIFSYFPHFRSVHSPRQHVGARHATLAAPTRHVPSSVALGPIPYFAKR